MASTSDRLGELTAKVDAFFARVEHRHGDDMQCATGCADCCHVRLTVTSVEAAAIRAHLAALPPARRAALAASAAAALRKSGERRARSAAEGGAQVDDRCAALGADDRCQIYAARPVVCRSHGAPIRMRQGSLPVVQSCHRNFTRVTPDADCVLDQETLSALTLAVDRAAGGDGTRVDLAGLLAADR